MKVKCTFPSEKKINETLKNLFPDTLDFDRMTINLSFNFPFAMMMGIHRQEWLKEKDMESFFFGLEGDQLRLDLNLHAIMAVSEIFPCFYLNLLKAAVYYESSKRIFYKLTEKDGESAILRIKERVKIEKLVSMMMMYHCLARDIDPDESPLDFLNIFIDYLDDDYRRCICFFGYQKSYYVNPLSLTEVFRLIKEIKEGTSINNINDVMTFFNDYIDARIRKRPETTTPFLPFFTEKQVKKWGHLNPNHGFFEE